MSIELENKMIEAVLSGDAAQVERFVRQHPLATEVLSVGLALAATHQQLEIMQVLHPACEGVNVARALTRASESGFVDGVALLLDDDISASDASHALCAALAGQHMETAEVFTHQLSNIRWAHVVAISYARPMLQEVVKSGLKALNTKKLLRDTVCGLHTPNRKQDRKHKM